MSWTARTLVPGHVVAPVRRLGEPLSLWGGFDPHDGTVTDRHHPDHGTTLTGTVLVMGVGRGSSSSSSVLAEAVRLGTAPAAIVLGEPDEILAVGALVAAELYGATCPVVVCDQWRALPDGHEVELTAAATGGPATIELPVPG